MSGKQSGRWVWMTWDHRTVAEWAARDLAKLAVRAEEAGAGDPADIAEVHRRIDDAVSLVAAWDSAPEDAAEVLRLVPPICFALDTKATAEAVLAAMSVSPFGVDAAPPTRHHHDEDTP